MDWTNMELGSTCIIYLPFTQEMTHLFQSGKKAPEAAQQVSGRDSPP